MPSWHTDVNSRTESTHAARGGSTGTSRWVRRDVRRAGPDKEAPPGFEPGVADLQSAALAAWRRGRQPPPYRPRRTGVLSRGAGDTGVAGYVIGKAVPGPIA